MDVKALQRNLNKFFNAGLKDDGIKGKYTNGAIETALKKTGIKTAEELAKILNLLRVMEEDYKKAFELYEPLKKFGEQFKEFDAVIFIAQFSLETNYLKSVIHGSYNLGNIKAREGEPFVEAKTTEYINGKKMSVMAKFRKYANYEEFFNDYLTRLLGYTRYKEAKDNINNPQKFYTALQKGGYATDPKYAVKLMAVYRLMDCYRKIKTA